MLVLICVVVGSRQAILSDYSSNSLAWNSDITASSGRLYSEFCMSCGLYASIREEDSRFSSFTSQSTLSAWHCLLKVPFLFCHFWYVIKCCLVIVSRNHFLGAESLNCHKYIRQKHQNMISCSDLCWTAYHRAHIQSLHHLPALLVHYW